MKKDIDIHDFNRRLELAEKLIAKANPISKINSDTITRFENYLFTQVGKNRITN